MSEKPTRAQLKTTLQEAWDTHGEYEEGYLAGVRDEAWAGFYAAFIIGRLGDFVTPTRLVRLLESVEAERAAWTGAAAEEIYKVICGGE